MSTTGPIPPGVGSQGAHQPEGLPPKETGAFASVKRVISVAVRAFANYIMNSSLYYHFLVSQKEEPSPMHGKSVTPITPDEGTGSVGVPDSSSTTPTQSTTDTPPPSPLKETTDRLAGFEGRNPGADTVRQVLECPENASPDNLKVKACENINITQDISLLTTDCRTDETKAKSRCALKGIAALRSLGGIPADSITKNIMENGSYTRLLNPSYISTSRELSEKSGEQESAYKARIEPQIKQIVEQRLQEIEQEAVQNLTSRRFFSTVEPIEKQTQEKTNTFGQMTPSEIRARPEVAARQLMELDERVPINELKSTACSQINVIHSTPAYISTHSDNILRSIQALRYISDSMVDIVTQDLITHDIITREEPVQFTIQKGAFHFSLKQRQLESKNAFESRLKNTLRPIIKQRLQAIEREALRQSSNRTPSR